MLIHCTSFEGYKASNVKLEIMKGNCEICGTEIEIKLCCSGRECGCMGMPTEPPVCSEKCHIEYMEKLKKGWEELRDSGLDKPFKGIKL